jgi:hypothetical protein
LDDGGFHSRALVKPLYREYRRLSFLVGQPTNRFTTTFDKDLAREAVRPAPTKRMPNELTLLFCRFRRLLVKDKINVPRPGTIRDFNEQAKKLWTLYCAIRLKRRPDVPVASWPRSKFLSVADARLAARWQKLGSTRAFQRELKAKVKVTNTSAYTLFMLETKRHPDLVGLRYGKRAAKMSKMFKALSRAKISRLRAKALKLNAKNRKM